MAQLDHLQLIRARVPIARRKTGGGGAPPGRGGGHGGALQAETRTAVAEQQAAKPAAFVDPSLLLRVQVDGHIAESEWERLGLSVVSSDADRTVLLFSSTGDLTDFMDRLSKFDELPANPDQKNPNYAVCDGHAPLIYRLHVVVAGLRRAVGSSSGTTRRGPYEPLACWA